MRVTHATFNLKKLLPELTVTPTNFVPEPTTRYRQLALALYRLAHGVSYTVLEDAFGVSKEAGCVFFDKDEDLVKNGKPKLVDLLKTTDFPLYVLGMVSLSI